MKYNKNSNGLKVFNNAMYRYLESKETKKGDSWVRCDIGFLEEALIKEIDEYKNSKTEGEKAHELVDIANFCMMLYNRHIEIRNIKSINQE